MALPADPLLPALLALAGTSGGAGRPESAPLRAQILTLPTQLLQAQTPVSLSGVVAGSPVPGQLRINTPLGEVQLRTPTEVPAGRAVTIVTRPTVPTEVFLLPNAAPSPALPANPAAPARAPQANALPQPAATQAGPAASASAGQPAPPTASLLAKGPLAGHIAGQAAPAGSPSPNAVAPTAPTAANPVRMPAPSASAPAVAASPPAAPTLSPASLLATLGIAAIPAVAAGAAYAAPAHPAQPSDLLALLADLRRLVGIRDPRTAERLLRRLPTPDRAGALAMLALPMAARRDALATWLGADIAAAARDAPEESGGDLLRRIAASLAFGVEHVEESGERIWHWRQLPLADQGHLVPLFIGVAVPREQRESGGGRKQRPPTILEFAVEIALTALGRARIGAVYQQRRLDIVVQSETPIPQDGRADIVAAVAAVFDEFGLGGSCRFEGYRGEAEAVKV